jgi:hypothetical protein
MFIHGQSRERSPHRELLPGEAGSGKRWLGMTLPPRSTLAASVRAFVLISGVLASAATGACKRTSRVVEKATVTRLGVLDGVTTEANGQVEGIEVQFGACPDVAWRIFLTSTGRSGVVPSPGVVSCLRGLRLGASIDVALDVTESFGGRGNIPVRIGPCELRPTSRDDFDGELKTTGSRVCPWTK